MRIPLRNVSFLKHVKLPNKNKHTQGSTTGIRLTEDKRTSGLTLTYVTEQNVVELDHPTWDTMLIVPVLNIQSMETMGKESKNKGVQLAKARAAKKAKSAAPVEKSYDVDVADL